MALKKIDWKLEEKILELKNESIDGRKIAEILGIGKTAVYEVLKKNRVPMVNLVNPVKKTIGINDLISLRLLYFCDDIELLSKRLAVEILYQKPEKIIISRRIQEIIKKEKINKVVSILDRVNMKCNLEYAEG